MAGQTASGNDRDWNLWFKIANNWYNYVIDFGGTGLTPPSMNDTLFDLYKKITYYTYVAVSIHP